MRRFPLVLCLIALLTPGMAIAASPVAYVYVQEDSSQTGDTAPSPISVYAAASDGKLTAIKGSPFQATGVPVENKEGTSSPSTPVIYTRIRSRRRVLLARRCRR